MRSNYYYWGHRYNTQLDTDRNNLMTLQGKLDLLDMVHRLTIHSGNKNRLHRGYNLSPFHWTKNQDCKRCSQSFESTDNKLLLDNMNIEKNQNWRCKNQFRTRHKNHNYYYSSRQEDMYRHV